METHETGIRRERIWVVGGGECSMKNVLFCTRKDQESSCPQGTQEQT